MRLLFKPLTMKHISALILFSFLSVRLFSQGTIIGMHVQPSNPTDADDIRVLVDLSFTSSGCPVDSQGHTAQGNTIEASSMHCLGFATAICNTTDTFQIGQLAAGTYTFNFTLSSGFGPSGCSPGIVPDDNDQLQFNVSPNVGINERSGTDLTVYPNPSNGVFQFSRPLPSAAELVDASGRVLLSVNKGSTSIDLNKLEADTYLLRINDLTIILVKH